MENDLERSVRLLEDALHTPTAGLFKSATPKRRQLIDLSMTSTDPDELRAVLESKTLMLQDTMALLADDTIMSVATQGSTPWLNTVDNLHAEFANVMNGCSGGVQVLDATKDLANCCADTLAVVQSLKSKTGLSELPEEKWLEDEKNSWRLLYVLYNDRIQSQNVMEHEESDFGESETSCIEELFKRDNLVRESQLVIDWLEQNALERDDPILHYSDWTYDWEHTLHQLSAPDTIAISSTIDIIRNIHPDAPHSQGLHLHHLDKVNEKKLCRRIFMEIRCGNLPGAQQLCYNSGQPWRAAMFEGWKLYHNPNEDSTNPMGNDVALYQDIVGNINRALWKSITIEACQSHSGLDDYEKAAMASLCGYLKSILPVCDSWEDHLWAYMRTMVDIRVESEIRDSIAKNYASLPDEYWEQKRSLGDIFAILETSPNVTIAREATEIYHVIQKHIIMDEIPTLINDLDEWSEDSKISTYLLRFFAHLVLFFESVGYATNRQSCERIVETYINRLSDMDRTELVAFYVSKLGKRKQILLYAKHCEKILNTEERKEALTFAEEYSLDVLAITKRIAETLCNKPTDSDSLGNLQKKLTQTDELKISALDWLLFADEQRVEALARTNFLIFKFLTLGKLDAAQLAINKIPHDSVQKIRSEGEVADEIHQIVKDYLSYKAYLDAHEGFNEWFQQFRNKPQPPADLPSSATFTEKVAHKHKLSRFGAETERWKLTTTHSAKTAKTLLYNVLLFPQGWLVGRDDAKYLRSVCIPEMVLLLFSVLSESGMHEEAVQLADLIATEKYRLYKVYPKEKLQELLEKICESSVALLNAKKDPFGCPSTA